MTETRLWWLAIGAVAYALIRLIEAYGLWRERRWAEWLGALSAGIYLPLELHAWVTRPSSLHALLLLANGAIFAPRAAILKP